MTSKEFIQSEIDNLKDMFENSKKLNCETIIKCSEEEIEQYNQILKDLETLEILRDNIAYVDIVKDQKETLEITIRVKEENRPKIKEWLDND